MKSELGLHETGSIIDSLAKIPDEELDRLVKAVKVHRAKTLRDKIPDTLKKSLLRKADRLSEGQVTSIIVKPELCFTFHLTRNRDYTEMDVDVTLVNEDDARSKALFELYDLGSYEFNECLVPVFSELEPHLRTMEEQETVAYDSWQDDYHHLQNEFGVNAWDLVEELRKGGV